MSKKLTIIVLLTDYEEKPYQGFERREYTLQREGLESADLFRLGKNWVDAELERMRRDIIF